MRPTCTSGHCELGSGWDRGAPAGTVVVYPPIGLGPASWGSGWVSGCLSARSQSQWTLVQVGLVMIQDPTQKLHDFHAISVLNNV